MLSRVRHHLPESGDSVGAAWEGLPRIARNRGAAQTSVGYLFALRSQLPDGGHAVQQERIVRGHSELGCTREMLGHFELALQRATRTVEWSKRSYLEVHLQKGWAVSGATSWQPSLSRPRQGNVASP
jgi:hypothetical protein